MSDTLNGAASLRVSPKTAAYTVDAAMDMGKCFTNEGATGAIVISLPAATVGQRYRFMVMAAFELRIDPNGTQTISLASGAQANAGKYVWADAVGEFYDIVCVKAGQWNVFGSMGTWTAEP